MKVPFIQFSDIYTRNKEEILGALDRVFTNGELILGDYGKDITELERWFADFIGVKHAMMTGSGTQALYLAYRALGIGPGDEVICPAMTFSATFDQIVALGGTPVLVDIGEEGLMDPLEVEKAITPKTKAIVPVHLEGKICSIKKSWLPLLVEDACQAVGASFAEQKVGSFGALGCFSFYPAKIFGTMGNAGMITTNDDELAYKVSNLRANYRFEKDPTKVDYGMNFEPDNAWAAILNVRKKYLIDYIKRRAEIAKIYDEGLQELEDRGLLKLPLKQEGRVYQDYTIRITNPKDKEELLAYLKENEIGFLGHDAPYYPDYPKLNLKFDLPKTRLYLSQQIRIPCNPFLTDEQVVYVIDTIKKFYER